MTDTRSKFDLGNEYVEKIRAAITAAEADGFKVTVDVEYDPYDNSQVLSVDIDLLFRTAYIDTIRNIEY